MINIRNGVYFSSISLNDGYLEVWRHLFCIINKSVYQQILPNMKLFRQLKRLIRLNRVISQIAAENYIVAVHA